MVTAGIDAGLENIKVVVLKDGVHYSVTIAAGSQSTAKVAEKALKEVAEKAGISRNDIEYIVATGAGKSYIAFANTEAPDFLCLAKGIERVLPSTKTVLDLGAQKSLAVRCDGGKVLKYAASGKCAGGSGTYLEVAANLLGIELDRMLDASLDSTAPLEILNTCAIFMESEIISLIHARNKPEDILRGVFTALARRVYSQLVELGIEKDLAVVGGVAKNAAMIGALQELASCEILVPDDPDTVGALGAALIAQEEKGP